MSSSPLPVIAKRPSAAEFRARIGAALDEKKKKCLDWLETGFADEFTKKMAGAIAILENDAWLSVNDSTVITFDFECQDAEKYLAPAKSKFAKEFFDRFGKVFQPLEEDGWFIRVSVDKHLDKRVFVRISTTAFLARDLPSELRYVSPPATKRAKK